MANGKNKKGNGWAKRGRQGALLTRVLINEFRGFFVCLIAALSISCWALYSFYPRSELPHEHLTWLQTLYYTWLMMFFESPLNFVDDWRIAPLFFLLPILGLVTIAEGVVHLGNLLFQHKRYSGEWQKMIATTMEDHIVVCGLGNVGIRVVQHLRRMNEEVVTIESDSEARFLQEMEGYQVPVLIGDCRAVKVLESANVHKAKAIICVTNNDLSNLEAALTARELNAKIRVVMRMFDQKLAKKIEKFLGIDGCYSSSARSSRLFAQAAISSDILDSFEFAGTVINAVQVEVEPNMPLVGETVDDIRHKHEVTVLLHEQADGTVDWNPSPTNVLRVGDKLLIMTDQDGIKRLESSTKPLSLPKGER